MRTGVYPMTGGFSASPPDRVGRTKKVRLPPPGRDRDLQDMTARLGRPLDRPGEPVSQTARPVLVLRFGGTHWVAIDRSPDGMFVDGAGCRRSTSAMGGWSRSAIRGGVRA